MRPHLAIILALLLLTGCTTRSKESYSGFLGDDAVYARLEPAPEMEGVKVYRKIPKPLAEYDAFILPPVKVYLNSEGRKRKVSDEELNELGQFFHNSVYEALRDRYRITNIPGPGVAILRLAITDADPNTSALDLSPGALIPGGGLGGASVEAELVDSVTGEQIAVALASSEGKRYEFIAGMSRWGHTQALLSEWAEMIRKRVDEDHGFVG